MRWWPLLLLMAGSVRADVCQREFYAQPVVYDRAMAIDFYYTAINLQSVADCVAFCGDRHFCRTAVYNAYAKTCAISYEYTLNCRYNDKRVREFDASSSGSHLIQIACVTKCNENGNRIVQKHKLLAGEPTEFPTSTPAVLRKVQLITGEPNDGLRYSQQNLARSRPRQDAPQEPGFVNKLVIENFTSGGILPVLDSRHTVRRKGQICYRLWEKKYLMGAAYEIHKEVSLQTCRCLCAHSYDQNSIFMCKSFNWRADGTCELNRANHLGRFDLIDDAKFLYQFIDCDVQVLMNIGTKFCTKEGLAISSTAPTTTAITTQAPTPLPTTDSTSTTVDFTSAPTESPTTPETNLPVTSTEAKITTIESSTHKENEETTAEKGEETTEQRTDKTVTSAEERAGFFVGTRKEGETRQEMMTKEVMETKTTEETTSTKSTTTEGALATEESTTAERTTESTTETATTTEETSTEQTTEGTSTTEEVITTTEVVTIPVTEESTTTETPSSTTAELTTATTPEPFTETTEEPSTSPTTENILHIETGTCFERISGHMMASGAAALEHDVSLEECECFCANSRESGRHGFECLSATYYHGERDCVLNLEDRQQKTKDFTRQIGEFNVTYLGMTCTRGKAIAALVKPDRGYGCRNMRQLQLTKPKKNRNKGAFTDECFFELPSYVLEGTALHVETNATPQQCKCLCITAEQKFGEACQSFQYYYEGAVCLLSKNNRYSNSEKFSALQEQQQQSYFEYRCASKEEKLKKYTEQMCLFQKALDDTHAEKTNTSSFGDVSRPLKALENKNLTSTEKETTSLLEGSGMEANETVVETSTAAKTTTTLTTTEITSTTTSAPTTTKKHRTPRPINRRIPETEGLEESDFAELESILSNNLEDPTTASPPLRKISGVKTVKFTNKVEKAKQEDTTSTTVTKPPTSILTTARPPTTTRRTTTTTKGPEYPSAGKCTYSALYQTAFFGRRTIKTVHVKTAADCFAACFALHCRSANLIAQGALNQCELFKDSLIDYRRPDMIGYDGSTVYFDGIRCDGI